LLLVATLAGCSGGPSDGPGKDSRSQEKTAGAKTGGNKLVGKWRFVRSTNNRDPDWGTLLEFTPDGKVAMHGPGYANSGTYSLEKNALTLNATVKNTYRVAKVTDNELVIEIEVGLGRNIESFEYRKE
jgi:hypothetical protein